MSQERRSSFSKCASSFVIGSVSKGGAGWKLIKQEAAKKRALETLKRLWEVRTLKGHVAWY